MIKNYYCVSVLFIVLIVCAVIAEAAPDQEHMKGGEQSAAKSQQSDTIKKSLSEKLSVTHHKIKANGRALKYSATAGYLQINDESDKPRVHLFFVAYEKKAKGDRSRRPIAFVFNGGPGASSVFLHFGAIGPKRVLMDGEGTSLPAETNLVNNEYTWLDFTDLVFIDPVGTGYSRAAQGVDAKQFYAVEEDVKLMGEFVRLYTTRYKRWLSPKFIIGESYGSTRAASLAGYVKNTFNMNLNGLVLISPALNFQTIKFNAGNDLPYILCVPSYTAAAWYHKKLSSELQHDFKKSMHDAEAWAQSTYCSALVKGDRLSAAERKNIIETLAQFTGLAQSNIENNNLRINAPR
ncbi:MAG: alpha/beta hydrolase, partial [Proteobacteria bacterium]|nr:alpha/beta hydrolase [Pseudomonadota bacterium]